MERTTCIEIGKRLKRMRLQNDLTLDEVGKRIGFHKSTIMRWENGDTSRIKLPIMEALAQLYGTTPEYLMGWKDEDIPSNACFYEMQPLPVISTMRAAPNEYSYNTYDESEEIPSDMLEDDEDYFFVRMEDDSMSPKIQKGDLLLIKVQNKVVSGDTALIRNEDGTGIVRRLFITPDSITVSCENGSVPPISYCGEDKDDVQILGKAIKLIRGIEQQA